MRVPLRALGLLYYLALEGPTPRGLLADLLYGHAQARQNLRVELHRLARALGRPAFPPGQDPLALPGWIRLERQGEGEAMEGLEAVEGLGDWVLEKRFAPKPAPPDREALLETLCGLSPPGLLVLLGTAGSGRRALARALAARLDLPFAEGVGLGGVRYLEAVDGAGVERILSDRRTLYVLGLDPGEPPLAFLHLRARYPPERMRVVALKPLSWSEATQGPLAGLAFAEAARVYLEAGGEPEHMRELLAAPGLPHRVLAQIRLRTRWLSQEARLALERASVHGGVFTEAVLEALDLKPHLEELERKGWLAYGDGGRFVREAERRLLRATLPPGQRAALEARVREALGEVLPPARAPLAPPGALGEEALLLPGEAFGLEEEAGEYRAALLEPSAEARLEPWLGGAGARGRAGGAVGSEARRGRGAGRGGAGGLGPGPRVPLRPPGEAGAPYPRASGPRGRGLHPRLPPASGGRG